MEEREELIYNMIDRLGDILEVDTSSIHVEFEEYLDVEAEVEYVDKDCSIITLRDCLSEERLKVCLAHELVHFKQYEEGRLINGHMYMMWEGDIYRNIDYQSAPWEIEAYSSENILSKFI